MITGIEHTAIASADAATLANWYSTVLGFCIVYRSADAIFVKAPDGTMIKSSTPMGNGPPSRTDPGRRHLALAIQDFDQAYACLVAHKITFVSEPQESNGKPHRVLHGPGRELFAPALSRKASGLNP